MFLSEFAWAQVSFKETFLVQNTLMTYKKGLHISVAAPLL